MKLGMDKHVHKMYITKNLPFLLMITKSISESNYMSSERHNCHQMESRDRKKEHQREHRKKRLLQEDATILEIRKQQ